MIPAAGGLWCQSVPQTTGESRRWQSVCDRSVVGAVEVDKAEPKCEVEIDCSVPALGRKRPECGKQFAPQGRTLTALSARVDSCGPVTELGPAACLLCSEMVDFKKSAMEDDSTTRRRKRIAGIAQAYRTSHEIMSAAVGIAVFAGLGYWLDGKLSLTPVLTICGATAGFVMAGFSLRSLLSRLDRESERRKEQRAESMRADNE